jgi:hypothetical protein
MQDSRVSCSECEGEMELGFILDMMNGAIGAQKWTEDAPKKSWWGGIKVKWKECRPVETLRCKSCGLLKSYAK